MAYSRNSVNWDSLMNAFDNGMIFVVDSTTFGDVAKYQLFGLPASYLKEMKLLTRDKSALFYFERNTHTISGIFTSTAPAEANINTKIWKHRNGTCKFPAQIRWRSVAELPTIPKDHPKLPKFLRTMKIKGKYLEPARLQELLMGYRSAIYGSNPAPRLHNPYLAQSVRSQRIAREGDITNVSHDDDYPPQQSKSQRGRKKSSLEWGEYSGENNDYHPQRSHSGYASPELRANRSPDWRNFHRDECPPPKGEFLLEYDSLHGPAHRVPHYNRSVSFRENQRKAALVYNEFNRKLASLGFYLNQQVYDEEGNVVKNPVPSVRGGYGGALHRPFLSIEEHGPQSPRDDYEYYQEGQYYIDTPLCY